MSALLKFNPLVKASFLDKSNIHDFNFPMLMSGRMMMGMDVMHSTTVTAKVALSVLDAG